MQSLHIADIPTTSLEVATSQNNHVRTDIDEWLFQDTAQNLSELIRDHRRGEVFKPVAIREVVPFVMEDAAQVFAEMAEDTLSEGKTLRIRDEQFSMVDKSIYIRLSQNLVDPQNEEPVVGMKNRISKYISANNPFKARYPFVPIGAKYAALTAVMLRYRPLCNLYNSVGKMEIRLVDDALQSDQPVSSVSLSRTAPANILMGVNYSIAVAQLNRLQLKIEVNTTGMKPGFAWGTMEFAFYFHFSSKPIVRGTTQAVVQYELPSDIFEIRSRNPTAFHAELGQNDIEALRAIQADIPVLERKQLSNIGTLIRKKIDKPKSSSSESNPFADPSDTSSVTLNAMDPHSMPSTPDNFEVGNSLLRPTTANLERIKARQEIFEEAVVRRRAMDAAAELMGTLPGVFGLAAVVSRLIGMSVETDVTTINNLDESVRRAIAMLPEAQTMVYACLHPGTKRVKIGLQPFTGAVYISFVQMVITWPNHEFVAS